MHSIRRFEVYEQQVTLGLLNALSAVSRYNGKEALFTEQSPEKLETLRQIAIVQSTESSNRIEGVVTAPDRLRDLLADKTTPRNRAEHEILAYRNVLNDIHTKHASMRLTPNLILQFHRDLYAGSAVEFGGKWKTTNNAIVETYADGTRRVRFRPPPAHRTEVLMRQLQEDFDSAAERKPVDPLLLIGAYIFDFSCIHPFTDGNGRMARLLTQLLLYKFGYEIGRYISLEKIIEDSKDSYYAVLSRSSDGWHDNKHNLMPWFEYLIGIVLLSAYKKLERRLSTLYGGKGSKRDIVRETIRELPLKFTYADVHEACPFVSEPTINRTLQEMQRDNKIRCVRKGRDAEWMQLRYS